MNYTRKVINQHLLEYLTEKQIKVKKYGKVHMMDCPFCNESESVNIIPNIMTMNCHACNSKFDLVDLVAKLENKSIDESIQYLKDLLNINIVTPPEEDRIEEIFDFYEKNKLALIPIVKGKKRPIWKDWTNKVDKNKEHWKEWVLYNKVNLSVLTGKNSGIVIIDLDILSKEEKEKVRGEDCPTEERQELLTKRQDIVKKFHDKYDNILNSPLIQETVGGEHLIYKYVEEFPKTAIEIDGIHIDLETDGGQVLIEPSQLGNSKRKFKELIDIPEMSTEFKELILSKITTIKPTSSESIRDAIETENFKINPTQFNLKQNGLENCCNTEFIKFGGILRKQLAIKDVEFVLNSVNQHFLETPMDYNAIRLMTRELEKYVDADETKLFPKILEFINNVEEATKRDIKEHTRETEERVGTALAGLVREGYIIKRGRYYKSIQKVEWQTNFGDYGQRLSYKVPYFDNYAVFRNGDNIIIGAETGSGKCISEGMLLTNEGLRDIKDIGQYHSDGMSKVTMHLRLFTGRGKSKGYRHPNYFYKEKVGNTIKITTKLGYELEGTPEHRIKMVNPLSNGGNSIEFRKLEDIKENDNVLIVAPHKFPKKILRPNRTVKYIQPKNANNVKDFDIPKANISDAMARFMGYVLGDGNLQKSVVNIYQDVKYKSICDDLIKIGEKINIAPSIRKNSDNGYRFMFHSCKLQTYIKTKVFGIVPSSKQQNLCSPLRQIPRIILQSPKNIQIAFIESFFNCESCLNKKASNLSITSASEGLIKTLQLMLLNFGIVTKRTSKKVKKYPDNFYWNLTLNGEMTYKFFQIFHPVKYADRKICSNYKKYHEKVFSNQFQKDYYFKDEIALVKIKKDVKYVYDFNIESKKYKENNTFWANGFVNHNTHQAMNIVKKFKDQGIVPYYIPSESGGRWSIIAQQLGLKEEDFVFPKKNKKVRPENVELEDNAVTIIDWLLPKDYSQTDKIFERFDEQLDKHGGLLIIFVQLRTDGSFYAKDLLSFFSSWVCKFKHEDETRITSYFETTKIREGKNGRTYAKIPCIYDKDSKLLLTVEEKGDKKDKDV